MLFAGLGGNLSEVHTSAEYAKSTQYGERIAHGYLTLAIADGLYMRTGFFEKSAVANLGIMDWTFNRPVKIGDTIHLEIRLKDKNWIKFQKAGVVFWKVKVINQRNETVASGVWKRLIREKEEEKMENDELIIAKTPEISGGWVTLSTRNGMNSSDSIFWGECGLCDEKNLEETIILDIVAVNYMPLTALNILARPQRSGMPE
jgi:acyl dehydratase